MRTLIFASAGIAVILAVCSIADTLASYSIAVKSNCARQEFIAQQRAIAQLPIGKDEYNCDSLAGKYFSRANLNSWPIK